MLNIVQRVDLGNGFCLREISPESDAAIFMEYVLDPEVNQFMAASSIPSNVSEAVSELEYWYRLSRYGNSYYWAIANDADEIVGTAGFNSIYSTHKRAELSYELSRKYWGRGVMSSALRYILKTVIAKEKIVRTQATVAQHNHRSMHLLERLGFKCEGELAKYECLGGKFYDFFMYSLIAEENM